MTTETHVHRWLLEPDKVQHVQGQCACGASKTFQGEPESPYDAIKNAPRGLNSLKRGSPEERAIDEVMWKFNQSYYEAF